MFVIRVCGMVTIFKSHFSFLLYMYHICVSYMYLCFNFFVRMFLL
jgi:hypothetical protein